MGCNCKELKKGDDIAAVISDGYVQLKADKFTKIKLIIGFIILSPIILISSIFRKWKKATE